MGRIEESTLEAIQQKVDIADLVREYVPALKRSGRSWKACCPFHQEKTPSFTVNVERQIFYCFGCQTGGDIFKFLMKMESLSFPEAVEKLGDRAGIKVAPSAESLGPREKERLKLREALAFAADFYRQILARSPEADAARRYLDSRGLDAKTRERFGVGFALSDGGSLLAAALRKGFGPDVLAKAGLVGLREEAGRYRDFFRGRVIYPISNPRGEIIGFGARAMGDYQPKYLNSPDTALFAKGKALYGLFEGLADVRKARRMLLLEGYMDVLAAHQFGATTACAPLGTAVTPEHAALIKRYAEEVVFVFDPDNAGASAALRGAELLLSHGLLVRIATVPEGLDPDELLHKSGVQAFEACLSRAQDLPDFQADRLLAGRAGPLPAAEKARIAGEVLSSVAKAADEVLKREWIRRLAGKLGVDEESLLFKLRGAGEQAKRLRPAPSQAAEAPEPMPPAEEAILRALFQSPALALEEGRLRAEDLSHAGARRILAALKGVLGAGARGSWSSELLKALEPADAASAAALLVEEKAAQEPGRLLDRKLEEIRLLKRYRELDTRVTAADGGGADGVEAAAEYNKVLKRLSDLRLLDRLKV